MKPLIGLILLLLIASQADACGRFLRRRCVQHRVVRIEQTPEVEPVIGVIPERLPVPRLEDIYREVQRAADTTGQQINATETSRVLSSFFDVLNRYPTEAQEGIIGQGLIRAQQRAKLKGSKP